MDVVQLVAEQTDRLGSFPTCEALPGPLPVEVGAGREGAADGADELGLLAALRLEEAVQVPVLHEGERRATGLSM